MSFMCICLNYNEPSHCNGFYRLVVRFIRIWFVPLFFIWIPPSSAFNDFSIQRFSCGMCVHLCNTCVCVRFSFLCLGLYSFYFVFHFLASSCILNAHVFNSNRRLDCESTRPLEQWMNACGCVCANVYKRENRYYEYIYLYIDDKFLG